LTAIAHLRIWGGGAELGVVDELFRSDVEYFEAAALCEGFRGGSHVRMPGLEMLSAGCVIQRIDPTEVGSDVDRWLADVEDRVRGSGSSLARVYLQRSMPGLEAGLGANAYRPAVEVALFGDVDAPEAALGTGRKLIFREIRMERDWERRTAIYESLKRGPDGHSSPAAQWVEMERRKCSAGYMIPFLILWEEQPCAAVNVAVYPSFVRLKNIVVHADCQAKGIGEQTVRFVADFARRCGRRVWGCFAFKDSPALLMYKRVGMVPVAQQNEWVKVLGPAQSRTINRLY